MGKFLVGVPVPTHFYLIAVRCATLGQDISRCNTNPEDLEVLSFIIPNCNITPCGAVSVFETFSCQFA